MAEVFDWNDIPALVPFLLQPIAGCSATMPHPTFAGVQKNVNAPNMRWGLCNRASCVRSHPISEWGRFPYEHDAEVTNGQQP